MRGIFGYKGDFGHFVYKFPQEPKKPKTTFFLFGPVFFAQTASTRGGGMTSRQLGTLQGVPKPHFSTFGQIYGRAPLSSHSTTGPNKGAKVPQIGQNLQKTPKSGQKLIFLQILEDATPKLDRCGVPQPGTIKCAHSRRKSVATPVVPLHNHPKLPPKQPIAEGVRGQKSPKMP